MLLILKTFQEALLRADAENGVPVRVAYAYKLFGLVAVVEVLEVVASARVSRCYGEPCEVVKIPSVNPVAPFVLCFLRVENSQRVEPAVFSCSVVSKLCLVAHYVSFLFGGYIIAHTQTHLQELFPIPCKKKSPRRGLSMLLNVNHHSSRTECAVAELGINPSVSHHVGSHADGFHKL